jgi:hypothetical protein
MVKSVMPTELGEVDDSRRTASRVAKPVPGPPDSLACSCRFQLDVETNLSISATCFVNPELFRR